MKVAFQELKVGDEFTDETGIKYRKIHDNAFCGPRHEKTAMVINHPVLGGTELLISPDITVDKIVKLTKFIDMKIGDVYQLQNRKDFRVKIKSNKGLDLETYDDYVYSVGEAFEVIGHIKLQWPQ